MFLRVLVIEPYPDLRAEIAATLRREHFVCDAVATPDEATVALNEYQYVVVDVDSAGDLAGLPRSTEMIPLTRPTLRNRAVTRRCANRSAARS
jgi:DNA-binding response OmpR family regulator